MRVPLLVASIAAVPALLIFHRDANAQTAVVASPPPLVGTPSSVAPPTPPTEAQSRAILHYDRGRAYYAAGRYRAAILELERAVQLDPNGNNLYFDLGLVYERVGRVDDALNAYRHYLDRTSDPVERERAERIVVRLRGARRELGDMQRRAGRADVFFWAATGISIASLTVGGLLLLDAGQSSWSSSAHSEQLVGEGALLVGGAFALSATILYFARDALPRNVPRCVTLNVGPRAATVGVRF